MSRAHRLAAFLLWWLVAVFAFAFAGATPFPAQAVFFIAAGGALGYIIDWVRKEWHR